MKINCSNFIALSGMFHSMVLLMFVSPGVLFLNDFIVDFILLYDIKELVSCSCSLPKSKISNIFCRSSLVVQY